eukprot:CAMPEP_0182422598 /NCGR_PEP_ID=MMETSP1167-20130531/8319_1 /TAXON_ID=2988 /ORGANISM="Mallomonas Sp, Strain CCMP3275" /LENGTH=707 /DNA_ID=CAMNT_0024600779 /DNA_START=50 /DNA_END=2173 /DNA_ORIENTATION=+
MELLVAVDDFCVKKVLSVAAYAGLEVKVIKGVSQEKLLSLHPQARSTVLTTREGCLTQHTAIVRYLAEMCPASGLVGSSDFEFAEVDQWLEFSWMEIDVAAQLLVSPQLYIKEFNLTENDKKRLEAHAMTEISQKLTLLDSILEEKTFLVGEQLTLADISICCTMIAVNQAGYYNHTLYPSFHRYFMTIVHDPKIITILDFTSYPTSTSTSTPTSSESFIHSGKWSRHRTRIKELIAQGESAIGNDVTLKGWIRTTRSGEKGKVLFVELYDGSTSCRIQLVLSVDKTEGYQSVEGCGGAGASLSVRGEVVPSPAKGQTIEIKVTKAEVLGIVMEPKNYPMAKKQHTLEFLREKAHLRPRSKMFSCALRMRHAMAYASHKFFNDKGFVYVHTPLITAADCEGAGEQFTVTTLLPEHGKIGDIPSTTTGAIDYSKDFFGRRCSLTVSGQLNVETHACALSDVYTFGPTFRAENSHTSRHLAEFWMIEPEICFADILDDAALAEDYVKYCASYALEHCSDDLQYLEEEYPAGEKGLRARLKNVIENDFQRITYTQAIQLLQSHVEKGLISFSSVPVWGDDLGSEHERYMSEKVFAKPTIVFDYPKDIKAFYMRLNDDGVTVAAMDILVPKIGELIGGAQREERLDILEKRCVECNLNPKDLWWYNDLRRYGSVPHAGFGLGFERLIMFVTGLENIRDVISFPRVPGHAEF